MLALQAVCLHNAGYEVYASDRQIAKISLCLSDRVMFLRATVGVVMPQSIQFLEAFHIERVVLKMALGCDVSFTEAKDAGDQRRHPGKSQPIQFLLEKLLFAVI